LYVILSFLTDFSYGILPKSKLIEFYLFSGFTLIEYSFFSYFIYANLHSKGIKRFIIGGSALFYGFAIFVLFETTTYTFDSLPATIESILIILYCIFFFFEELNVLENSFIYSSKKFWIIVGILIYLAATLFLFISTTYLTAQQKKSYWSIIYMSNILKNVLFSIAFLLPATKTNRTSMQKPYNISSK